MIFMAEALRFNLTNAENTLNGAITSILAISHQPSDFETVEFHRFEGNSNPSDMGVVYAIETKDGERALLIDAYGTYAGEYPSEMLNKLDLRDRS
jgi:hypothetical protein